MLIGFGPLGALLSVVMIDVVLAGDNAIVVGLAAAALPVTQQRRVIALGIAAATLLRILFAYFAARLLTIIGLGLAGGILLLWVAWKLFRELREPHDAAPEASPPAGGEPPPPPRARSPARVFGRIVLADVSMSLDNVLAVAGTAQGHFWVLAFGLALSVALMGVASTLVARLLARHRWISWVGLAIVTLVALRMIWDGSAEVLASAEFLDRAAP